MDQIPDYPARLRPEDVPFKLGLDFERCGVDFECYDDGYLKRLWIVLYGKITPDVLNFDACEREADVDFSGGLSLVYTKGTREQFHRCDDTSEPQEWDWSQFLHECFQVFARWPQFRDQQKPDNSVLNTPWSIP